MAVNVLLTFTDQAGWADVLYVVPALAAFVLLLTMRKNINVQQP